MKPEFKANKMFIVVHSSFIACLNLRGVWKIPCLCPHFHRVVIQEADLAQMRKPPHAKIIDVSSFTARPKCGKIPDLLFFQSLHSCVILSSLAKYAGEKLDHRSCINVEC